MKRIICIIATIFLCFTGLKAQESGAVTTGRVLTDVGKSVTYISSGVALTGATMLGATLIYNAQQPDGTNNVGEAIGTVVRAVVGAAAMGVGAIGALAGAVIWTPGEIILHVNGESPYTYENEQLRGFGMNLDLGGSLGASLYPRITAGYNFSKAFFLGAGTSYNINLNRNQRGFDMLPVFATMRVNIGKTAVTPYWDLDCGVDVLNKCKFYMATSLGVRYRLSEKQNSIVAGTYSEIFSSHPGAMLMGLKVGYSF